MVNFLDPVEYLYGTGDFDNGAEQGGIYNRHMISVRLEEWPAERILELHNYYLNLEERTQTKQAKFSLLFSPLYNLLARLMPDVRKSSRKSLWCLFNLSIWRSGEIVPVTLQKD